MCLNQVLAKKARNQKKIWPGMILTHDLPTPPILQKGSVFGQIWFKHVNGPLSMQAPWGSGNLSSLLSGHVQERFCH